MFFLHPASPENKARTVSAASVAPAAGGAPPQPPKQSRFKSGFLLRQGQVLKRWAQRFYVLRDKFLFYFKQVPRHAEVGMHCRWQS
jgi:hypothetical protein